MFLKQITQKSGRTKLCVYESYREGRRTRQRTVRALGYVDELSAEHGDPVAWARSMVDEMNAEMEAERQSVRVDVHPMQLVDNTPEGTPQGSPLSLLLANVLLNELDWELERHGHVFVRYADDFVIMKRSRKAAERAMESMVRFVEGRLFLRVNREKSFVARITQQVK